MAALARKNYSPTQDSIDNIGNTVLTGNIIIVTRPRAQNAAYVLIVTDVGALRVFNKDGSLKWSVDSGISTIAEASINNNAEVLIRYGTTPNILRMYSSTGTQVWDTGAVAGLLFAKIGTSWVGCYVGGATDQFQWRKLADGLVDSTVPHYTVLDSDLMNIAVDGTGSTIVMLHDYQLDRVVKGGVVNEVRLQGINGDCQGVVDCNYDATIIAVSINSGLDKVSKLIVYDGGLSVIGSTSLGVSLPNWRCKVNPNGTRVFVWRRADASSSAGFATTSPYSFTALTTNFTVSDNDYAADISDEFVLFVGGADQKVHIFEDSAAQKVETEALGVANISVAVVRNV